MGGLTGKGHVERGLYERNWRHVQPDRLEPTELAPIEALREVFGSGELRV